MIFDATQATRLAVRQLAVSYQSCESLRFSSYQSVLTMNKEKHPSRVVRADDGSKYICSFGGAYCSMCFQLEQISDIKSKQYLSFQEAKKQKQEFEKAAQHDDPLNIISWKAGETHLERLNKTATIKFDLQGKYICERPNCDICNASK